MTWWRKAKAKIGADAELLQLTRAAKAKNIAIQFELERKRDKRAQR